MGRISDDDVQRVRDATDIVPLVTETVPLRQKGRLFWGLCPFHGEKTPSMKVDPATQLWHCFGCGLGGDVFGFVMKTQNLEFPDAVRLLADRARIEITEEAGGLPQGRKERLIAACEAAADHFHKTLIGSKDAGAQTARDYLAHRGFGSGVAKRWRLGYATGGRDGLTKHLAALGFTHEEMVEANLALSGDDGRLKDRFFNRVMFPIGDLNGRAIAFGGRVIGEGNPKYLNSSDTPVFHKSANLYAIDRAKSAIVASGAAVVVEGYTDAIALHEAGITNAVATLGTALTERHVKLLGRFAKRIVYLFDGDEAGMRAADRAAEFLDRSSTPEAGSARLDLFVAVIPAGSDPADFVGAEGAAAMRTLIDEAQPLLRFVIDRRLDAHDLNSPEDRTRALAAAAGVLASVKGSILVQDYANHVADRLMTDYSTVQEAVRTARPPFDRRPAADEETGTRTGPARARKADAQTRAESELVRLLVVAPELRGKLGGLLEMPEPFSESETARMVAAIVASGRVAGKELYGSIVHTDRALADALSAFLVDTLKPDEAVERYPETYARVVEFALKREIVRTQATMRIQDADSDAHGYDVLFRRAADLQQALAELRAGVTPDLARFKDRGET
jgi:DNA primase